ncbi:MAG TPA: glycerophosphodiester phosphodiesterase [Nocardioidaceae bacterium]|nr:glycerophosphodiester phosphodiesterase [Nocardioidaceae bacterium]
MSNAIIKQGADSRVADNVWEFHIPENFDLEPLLRWLTEAGVTPGDLVELAPELLKSLAPASTKPRPVLPLVAGLAMAVGGAAALNARRQRAGSAVPRATTPTDWPINFAHRGGSGIGPENTIEGFHIGLEAGGGVIETDVHTTADGHVVVIHDPDTARTTGESVRVSESTLARLQELNAAATFQHADTHEPWDGPPVRIPTLADVYREFPDRKVNIEIKGERQETVEALWGVIQECDAVDRTLVVGTSTDKMKLFRQVSGGAVPTGASTPEIFGYWICHMLHLPQPGVAFQALQVPKRFKNTLPVVTTRFTEEAHEGGLRVDVWTIDEPDEMREMLDAGVDGVMTDRPDLLAKVLASRT